MVLFKSLIMKSHILMSEDFNSSLCLILYISKRPLAIIDVITINKNDSIQFGAPIFETESRIQNRIIFQYSTDVGMSLNYIKKRKMIIYDHLSPKTANLEGFYNTQK